MAIIKYHNGTAWIQVAPSVAEFQGHTNAVSPHSKHATLDAEGNVPATELGNVDGMEIHGNEYHDPDYLSTLPNHNLINTTHHPASGLTSGHFLKATGTTTYAFGAHGLTAADVGALPIGGGTMTGVLSAQNNTSYTTYQVRNITIGTSSTPPAGMGNGDIYFQYGT